MSCQETQDSPGPQQGQGGDSGYTVLSFHLPWSSVHWKSQDPRGSQRWRDLPSVTQEQATSSLSASRLGNLR